MKRMTNYWKKGATVLQGGSFQLAEMKRIRLLPPIVEWVKEAVY